MSFNPGGNGGIFGATDVALSNPSNSQVLTYDGVVAKWKNAASAGGASKAEQIRIWNGTQFPARDASYGRSVFFGPDNQDPRIVADAADYDIWERIPAASWPV